MKMHLNDNELIELIICDDRKAFTQLYKLYINNLYRYSYSICGSKETSEEIVQNVFIMIWENRKQLNSITSFKAYIYRCVKNALLNEIRKEQTEARILVMSKPDTEMSSETSDKTLIYNQYYQIAQDAINLLPEKRKQIVELRTKEDLTLNEIAERLSISKSVVKKQFYLGRDFIKDYLHKTGVLAIDLFLFIAYFFL